MPEATPNIPVLPAQPALPQPAESQRGAPPPPIAPAAPTAPASPEKPPASAADGSTVDVIKDTYIGGILSDFRKNKKGDTSKESVPVQAPPTPAPSSEAEGTGDSSPSAGGLSKPAPGQSKSRKKKEAPAPPPVDANTLAQTVANATLHAQRQFAREQEQAAAAKATEVAIPDSVRKMEEVYAELHTLNPEKYPKDLSKKMAAFVNAENARADAWEKEHPGENYDSESEEHADWYEKNQPDINAEDLMDARVSVKAAAKAKEYIDREVQPKQAEMESQVTHQKLDPELRARAATLGLNIMQAFDPELKEFSQEKIDAFKEKDPIAFETAVQADETYARVVYDAGLIWNGVQKYNHNHPGHRETIRIVEEFEKVLSEIPPEDIQRGGRVWVPLQTYGQLTPAQKQRAYTTSYDDVVDYIRTYVAPSAAKQAYDQKMQQGTSLVEKLAPRLGYTKTQAGNSPSGNGSSQHQPTAPSPTTRVSSPSVGAGSPAGANGSGGNGGQSDWLNKFWNGVGVR